VEGAKVLLLRGREGVERREGRERRREKRGAAGREIALFSLKKVRSNHVKSDAKSIQLRRRVNALSPVLPYYVVRREASFGPGVALGLAMRMEKHADNDDVVGVSSHSSVASYSSFYPLLLSSHRSRRKTKFAHGTAAAAVEGGGWKRVSVTPIQLTQIYS